MNAKQQRMIDLIRQQVLRQDGEAYEDLGGADFFEITHEEIKDSDNTVSIYIRTARKDGKGWERARHIFIGKRGAMFVYEYKRLKNGKFRATRRRVRMFYLPTMR